MTFVTCDIILSHDILSQQGLDMWKQNNFAKKIEKIKKARE